MKIAGIEGSYQLRKIKGRDGVVREYWYHYWYEPATKKMQCKREDPPSEMEPKAPTREDWETFDPFLAEAEREVHFKSLSKEQVELHEKWDRLLIALKVIEKLPTKDECPYCWSKIDVAKLEDHIAQLAARVKAIEQEKADINEQTRLFHQQLRELKKESPKLCKEGLRMMGDKIGIQSIEMFWDHTTKQWERKRLDLKRIPMKYRCPTCGKIVVEPEDRNPKKYVDPNTGEVKWLPNKYEKTAKGILDGIFGTGGVCEKCWLDGLGKYGDSLLARMLRLEQQEQQLVPIHSMGEYKEWKLKGLKEWKREQNT